MKPIHRLAVGLGAACTLLMAAGCHTDMWIQPKVKPQQESDFFPDGQGSRPLVEGAVSRNPLKLDDALYTGKVEGKLVSEFPVQVDKTLILRGRERYNIACSPCHGKLGDGGGMIAQRGFALRRPPGNYHTDRLREMPVGHFFDVITNGYGTMYPAAIRVQDVRDRWAIVAYIRALQKSQYVKASDLTADEREKVAKDTSIYSTPAQATLPSEFTPNGSTSAVGTPPGGAAEPGGIAEPSGGGTSGPGATPAGAGTGQGGNGP